VVEYYTSKRISPPLTIIGLPDEFGGQASRQRLLNQYGLDAESIANRVRKAVRS